MSEVKNQKRTHQYKAVAYCRVATATQKDTNQSIEVQKQLISEKAQGLGVKIVKWCEAVGQDQRKVLKEAYDYCKTHHVCYLFVASPDRLSRLSTDYDEWGRKFWDIGTMLQSAKSSNDSIPTEAFKDSLLDVNTQFERQLRSYQVKQGLAAKRREN